MLKTFHSQEYLDHLKELSNEGDEEKVLFDCEEDFGIGKGSWIEIRSLEESLSRAIFYCQGYDCPLVEDLFDFCCTVAGASITAAHLININKFKYVINWFGGWHHAKR